MIHHSLISSRLLSIIALGLILASLLPHTAQPVSAQTSASSITGLQGNGIFVDSPKVYDDFSLRIMLNAARARLAALQVIDQNALTSRIGAVTGASLTQSSLAAQVLGPPVPQSAVTSSGATGSRSTVTTDTETQVMGQAPAGPSSSTTNVGGTVTTLNQGQPVQNTVTTNPQMTAGIPTMPSSTAFGLPTNFSISSLDALGEAMQLTFEIANIQLLLEGSLSDRYVRGERVIKPKTTLGFPITISPDSAYKDAVAVVDVELEAPPNNYNEPPAVTTLLPREKTYNVASITDKSTSIGGGFVSQVISGGLTWFRGRKTYYLVKDQDTLAMQHTSNGSLKTSFAWQFQPVLGQRFVRPGMRQTFVQIANAVPEGVNFGCFGKVKVTTYWREYDRKHGILKDIIPESIRTGTVQPIARYDITPVIGGLGKEDLGSGLVLTKIKGNFGFLSGTYVRVGPNIYRDGSPGFTYEDRLIRFVAPAADIAKYRAYIVSRDGTETEIFDPRDPEHPTPISLSCDGTARRQEAARVVVPPVLRTEITAFDNNNSVVTATLTNPPTDLKIEDYLIVIGGRVFGLSDAPITRSPGPVNSFILRAVVPTNLLMSATAIQVKPLFWKKTYEASQPIAELHVESTPDKVVLLTPTATGARFLLYGNRLGDASILIPANVQLQQFNGFAGIDTLRTFELSTEQWKTVKQIVLQKGASERPTFLSVPSPPPDKAPTLTATERVTVGSTEIDLTSIDNLSTLKYVRFKGREIKFLVSEDKKSITLFDFGSTGLTTAPVKRALEFEFEDKKKSNLTLDIINSKVETVNRSDKD